MFTCNRCGEADINTVSYIEILSGYEKYMIEVRDNKIHNGYYEYDDCGGYVRSDLPEGEW